MPWHIDWFSSEGPSHLAASFLARVMLRLVAYSKWPEACFTSCYGGTNRRRRPRSKVHAVVAVDAYLTTRSRFTHHSVLPAPV